MDDVNLHDTAACVRDDHLAGDALAFAGRFQPRAMSTWRELATHHRFFARRVVLACDRPVLFPLGRITAIMGPSGAGKTTLMRMASGRAYGAGTSVAGIWLVRVNSDGHHMWRRMSPHSVRCDTAFVDQADDALDAASTPRDLVRFYVDALHRVAMPSAIERAALVERVLGDVRLRGRAAATPVGCLSGGQRKRTSIALQLARARDILFLDEPTSGLDSSGCQSVFAAIARVNRRRQTTVVMVVHQPSERMLADVHWLVLMAAGMVVYQGRPDDALASLARHALAVQAAPDVQFIHDDNDGGEDDDDDDDDNNLSIDGDIEIQRTATVPDRIIAHIAQAADETEGDYEVRMQALSYFSPTYRPTEMEPSVADAKLSPPHSDAGTCALAAGDDGPTRFLRGVEALSALFCVFALAMRRTAQAASGVVVAQACLKHLGLPVLMVLALAEAMRGRANGADDVVAAHALAAMAIMWTSLDAAWETFAFLPGTDRQFVKQHEDGVYGAVAHLTAAHVADSVVRLPLLVCFSVILYFGAGMRADAGRFFVFLAALLLMALVARSICFACTCWLRPAHAVLTLSLILAASIIASGAYVPFYIMPEYARGLAYASFVTYGLSIVVRNQFDGTVYTNASRCAYATGDAVVGDYASAGTPVWLCFVVLLIATTALALLTWVLLVARARTWRRV